MRRTIAATVMIGLTVALSAAVDARPPRTTTRSLAARKRVSPSLKRDLALKKLRLGAPVFMRIFKAEKQLEVWVERSDGGPFVLFRTYAICTYSGALGPKLRQGDGQAPEGFYFVNAYRMNPASQFHLSFNLGYPNAYDRYHRRTGNYLMVHGNCVSIGCYAMTNPRIEQIYTLGEAALIGGQRYFRVHSFPFRMTEANMKKHAASKHAGFWKNLKDGYDHFERTKRPPNVEVERGRYVFGPT